MTGLGVPDLGAVDIAVFSGRAVGEEDV